MDLGSEDRERAMQLNRNEAAAEDMRLLYVALTRASSGVRIYWGDFAGIEGSALGSFLHPGGSGKGQSLFADLEQLCATSDQSIEAVMLQPDTLPDGIFDDQTVQDSDFIPKTMTRKIAPAWRISSYSALAAGHIHDPVQDGQKERQEPNPDIFLTDAAPDMDIVPLSTFPKGPGAGDFFHKVFEEIDFVILPPLNRLLSVTLTDLDLPRQRLFRISAMLSGVFYPPPLIQGRVIVFPWIRLHRPTGWWRWSLI